MLMRFDPFRDFDRLAQQLVGNGRVPVMPMDAFRSEDQFVVRFDLPGVDPSSIELTVEKNVLTVSAERSWQPGDGAEVVASERPHGSFTRQLFLGDTLDPDRIKASYEAGVLTLTVPVAEQAKPRRIEIASNGSQRAIETTSSETASSEKSEKAAA